MAISISSIASFFVDNKKNIDRGENHYKSGHVEQCSLDAGLLTGYVRASMRDKVYRVSVSKIRERGSYNNVRCKTVQTISEQVTHLNSKHLI